MMKKPGITKSNHVLPFGELSPAQFERLCLWLVKREGYLRPEHLGEAGSEQGRDVIAYRATGSGEQLWYFQCKRYQTISASKLIEEVEKYNKLVKTDPAKKPFGVVFVTNAVLSADAREKVRKFCGDQGYDCEFWARTELDLLVKKHKDVVAEFFDSKGAAAKKETRVETTGTHNIIIQDATGVTINTSHGGTRGVETTRPSLPQNNISIARLPVSGPGLFGRDAELKRLDDAWADPGTNIIAFVAWGGVGKTALVNHWLKQRMARDNYRGAERIYGWSFFSQGTSERATSADLFIDQALRWFGDTDPTQGSPWDKGERLAHFIRQTRTLLILDGLEPLQHPPGTHEGRLKDAALQALLVELAAHQPGLCVISTRERVGDLVEFEDSAVVQHELEHLSLRAGAQLLRALKVKGDDEELEEAAREFGGHAFSLTLLGSYLDEVLQGDIRRRKEIENLFDDTRHGDNAQKMIAAYEKWLGESVELAVLRMLGLFDRPAESASIAVLRAAPAIPGLTEALQNLKGREWQQALSKLRRIKLLANDPDPLDAHPLVREHFKQQLKRECPEGWREANNRLYEHLTRTTKEFPDTVEEMSPLFAAVSHGCAAGRHQEALEEVYWLRIQREKEAFSTKKLGAIGANLAVLSNFFEAVWEQPDAGLSDVSKAYVLTSVGYCLRALGRLQEAAEAIQAGQQINITRQDWKNAAIQAINLSELYLTIGDLLQVLKLAQQSIGFADRCGDKFLRTHAKARLADALHQVERTEEAVAVFREAEEMQKSEYPILYSFSGFQYCDLLLSQGQVQQVKERAVRMLDLARQQLGLLEIALDNLSLGRALLLEAQQTGTGDTIQAGEYLQRAVAGLRQAGTMHELPRGLLARAELHRFNGEYVKAERDLAETLRIATRGPMGLHLADYHLESARLRLAQGDRDKAREHLATATEMIERMGYHRRDGEVKELERQLAG
ncbi:MAG TPA: restriction endonuclease [Blastocatellia bacterium]|nr:restriction endonuclease [Blastocatellia bacterium]